MPHITFPQVLQRHVKCPPIDVEGRTLRAVLDAAFEVYPSVRGYLLDDAGAMRKHITMFIDGVVARDREGLRDRVGADSQVDVLQALSGG